MYAKDTLASVNHRVFREANDHQSKTLFGLSKKYQAKDQAFLKEHKSQLMPPHKAFKTGFTINNDPANPVKIQ